MLATFNSRHTGLGKQVYSLRKWRMCAVLQCLLLVSGLEVLNVGLANAATTSFSLQLLAGDSEFASRAEKAYQTAKAHFQTQPNDGDAAAEFSRTCYDWADYVSSPVKKEAIALEGISASRMGLSRNSSSAAGHYYLAMNMAQLASTKKLGALKIVEEMEAEFGIALGLDAKFDYAGPDRNLGLLYHQAPGWPISVGNKIKAHQHLQKAVKFFPNYPENALNLIEADLDWGDKAGALRQLNELDAIWEEARIQFTGEKWESSWIDWEMRRNRAKKKTNQPSQRTDTPRTGNR